MLLLENCGLKFAIDIVDSWSVGDICDTCQDLGFLCRRQCGEGNDRLPQGDNETVSKMKLTN